VCGAMAVLCSAAVAWWAYWDDSRSLEDLAGRSSGEVSAPDRMVPVVSVQTEFSPRPLKAAALVFGGMMLVFVAAMAVFRLTVTRRLGAIAARFRAVAEGGEDAAIEPVAVEGHDEVADLARHFNAFAKRLSETRAGLQKRMPERADALARANEELRREAAERRQAEAEGARLLQRFQAIMDNIPAYVFLKDREGRYTAVNRAFHDLLPRDVEDPVGRCDRDLFSESVAARLEAEDLTVLDEGRVVTKEESIRLHDGRTVHLAISLDPVRSHGGRITGLVGVAMDISDRKHTEQALRESEERFRLISDAAHDAIGTMDAEGRVSYWNPAAEMAFGYTRQEILGRPVCGTLLTPEVWKSFEQNFPNWRMGQGGLKDKLITSTARRKDGTTVPVELSLSSMRLGGQWHTLAIFRDASKQQRVEEHLHRTVTELQAFHRLAVSRELRMIELKREVNEMAARAGLTPPYELDFAEPVVKETVNG